MDSLALFQCLQPCLSATTLRQLSRIAVALLTMTGRGTMAGIARASRLMPEPELSQVSNPLNL